jgi:2'-hydroxyisoflavone reductase
MRVLVLGGTIFLGRHIVEQLLGGGHEVTLFNRGRHNPELFSDVEKLRGDRDGDLGALEGRTFDAVIDTCGYVPRVVGASAELLADACGHYTFVSSLSVYAGNAVAGEDENAPLATLDDPTVEEITGETYGGLKRACERAVEEALPGKALIVRPGLIVGPHDPSDRFTYWPARIARGGDVLAAGPAEAKVEFTDVRDLARWIVSATERSLTGAFNVSGPEPGKLERRAFLDLCRDVAGSDARVVWADEGWLAENEVALWSDMPMCVGSDSPGFCTRSTKKSMAAGMEFRPAAETIRDTLEWAEQALEGDLKAGLSPDREAALLSQLG